MGFVDLEQVIGAVAKEYGVEKEELSQAWRRGEEKAVAIYLARRLTGLSGAALGKRFGVTAARVSQLVKRVGTSEDSMLKKGVARLEERLRKDVS